MRGVLRVCLVPVLVFFLELSALKGSLPAPGHQKPHCSRVSHLVLNQLTTVRQKKN